MKKFSVTIPVESTIFLTGIEAKNETDAWEKALEIALNQYQTVTWALPDDFCQEDWIDEEETEEA